ncbi:MAG: tetratricopeptide repeat protein [Chitinophagaceae bacterium]|jgi:tetratricopeptide (TPR) repeat protein|nr:tetratricopeptide repeat protein [Chitinophagaceae bacterium]
MKPLFSLLLIMLLPLLAVCQIDAANKCYDEKNYECAVNNYKAAIAARSYNEKDFATIKFRIGFGYSKLERFGEAVAPLIEAITSKPDLKAAYWELAYCYYSLKEYTKSADYYSKAAEYYKSDTASLKRIQYWRGRALSQAKNFKEAITAYKAAIAIDSTQSDYYASLGDANYNQALYIDACTAYEKSVALGSSSKSAMAARYYWLGQSYNNLYKRPEALKAYQQSLEFDPAYKWSHWGIAGVYYNQAKWKDAVGKYTQTLTYFNDDTASQKSIYYWRARCYFDLKDYAKASADLDQALKIDPAYGSAYWEKGLIARTQKKFKEAIPFYTRAIELTGGQATSLSDLHYARGLCYLSLKDSAKAEKDFEQAVGFDEFNIEANIELGHLAFARKDYNAARLYFEYNADELFIGDSTEFSRIYFHKGLANYMSGDNYFYTAKEDFLTSIGYDSTNREAHRWLGDAYYRQQYYALAEKEMDKCVVLYKNVKDSLANIYLYRGMARYQQKKYKEALADYEQADKLAPFKQADQVKLMGQMAFEIKDYNKAINLFTRLGTFYKPAQKDGLVFVHFARGRCYQELKKKKEAVDDLKKALEFSPGNAEVTTWLRKAEALD